MSCLQEVVLCRLQEGCFLRGGCEQQHCFDVISLLNVLPSISRSAAKCYFATVLLWYLSEDPETTSVHETEGLGV